MASSSLDSEPRSPPPDQLGDDDDDDDVKSCGSQSDIAAVVPDLLLKPPAPDGAAAAPLSPDRVRHGSGRSSAGTSPDTRPATTGGKIDMHPRQAADVRKNCHVAVYKKSANGGYLDVDVRQKSGNSSGDSRFKNCCCVIL